MCIYALKFIYLDITSHDTSYSVVIENISKTKKKKKNSYLGILNVGIYYFFFLLSKVYFIILIQPKMFS